MFIYHLHCIASAVWLILNTQYFPEIVFPKLIYLINKAITDKNTNYDNSTEKFDPYNSTFDQLIKEDRKLLNEGKIAEKDYGSMMIHAFVSRVHVVNGKLALTSSSDYSQNWVSTFNDIQQSHQSAGLSQDYDEDRKLQEILEGLK